jgi:aminoglycoside 6'-N-acetyltransferase I
LAYVLCVVLRSDAVGLTELSIRYDVAGALGIRTGYIEGLYLMPAERNLRMNRKLIDAAYRWAIGQHCRAVASDRAERVVLFRTVPQRYMSMASGSNSTS